MGQAIGSIASMAGSMMGKGGGGGGKGGGINTDVAGGVAQANTFLDQALAAAIPYTEYFTTKALDAQKEQFNLARNDIQKYYELGQAQTAPYREAGYQALDTYQDTLGQSRLLSGSSAMAHAMENKAKQDSARQLMQAQALQTANQMKMNPNDTFAFANAATVGSNLPGLMFELQKYQMGHPTANKPAPMQAQSLAPQANFRGDPKAQNPYNPILANTSGTFNQAPITSFLQNMMPLASQLSKATNSMTSRDRTLAQLGTSGYSQLKPTVMDVE